MYLNKNTSGLVDWIREEQKLNLISIIGNDLYLELERRERKLDIYSS